MKDDLKTLTIHLPRDPWNERAVFAWGEIDWHHCGGSLQEPEQIIGSQFCQAP